MKVVNSFLDWPGGRGVGVEHVKHFEELVEFAEELVEKL